MKKNMWCIFASIAAVFLLTTSGCVSKEPVTTPTVTSREPGVSPTQVSTPSQMTATPTNAQPTPATVSVDIKDFSFIPATVTINKGTTVIWKQEDSTSHTVTSTDTGVDFNSGELSKGQTFSHTFNEKGTFNYICSFHQSMTGKIIVT